jgi:Aspartyl protease
MSRLRGLLGAFLVSAIGSSSGPALAAEACRLTPVAALPLLRSSVNLPIAPAHIADQWSWLIIDTGAIRSLLFAHAADALKLPRNDLPKELDKIANLGGGAPPTVVRRGPGGFSGALARAPLPADTSKLQMLSQLQTDPFSIYGAGGQSIHEQTPGQHVRLGKLDFPDVSFLVVPDAATDMGEVAGMFGMASLGSYDIELNLAQHWINLFSQDHCDGKVVYWSQSYLAAPIRVNENGQLLVEVKLDGQSLWALIDSGASHSSIRQGDASWLFGITPQSPGAEVIGTTLSADGGVLTTYRAPFRTLELAGVTFNNPEIHVLPDIKGITLPDRNTANRRGNPTMTLGVEELTKLRVYLAVKERMLYLTPAEPEQPT